MAGPSKGGIARRGSRPRPRARKRGLRRAIYASAVALALSIVALGYGYVSFARIIDDRLHGERERTFPRVYARAVELRRGQSISTADFVGRLNDLGYAQRPEAAAPGEFSIARNVVTVVPRSGESGGKTIAITFPPASHSRDGAARPVIAAIAVDGRRQDRVQLDPPLLTALMTSGAREKRRRVSMTAIPTRMQQAIIAIEDQSFYSHPGINPVRLMAAVVTNVFGDREQLVGYSTITQQLARMFFLADEFNAELQAGERSYWRKMREGAMSLVLESRATKDEIFDLYLNDVYLGQRGSFAIHGVAEASRIFFGKDIANLTLSQAAVIAGVIRSPASRSPFGDVDRAIERRNTVLQAMHAEGYITETEYIDASREPLQVVARSVDNEAPYFVDMVGQQMAELFPGVTTQPGTVEVHTTLDLNMQRSALDAVRVGLARVDELLAGRRKRPTERAQAALVAVDPHTGEIRAMVGGRSYNQSQFNRAVAAHRQPGSVFKPFVYLAAFEQAVKEGRVDVSPASLTLDEPSTFTFDDQVWEPRNYDDYDGEITWRRALAMSRNLGTIRVGEQIGFDNVAALWRRAGVGTPPKAYPAITLGVFELTPIEVATAYTLFQNHGAVRPLRAIAHVQAGERTLRPAASRLRPVARPDTTYLVTDMMRSVLDEGTGAGARAAGFTLDAAGKSGTTNDLRDAWFVGFTPDLLTVVWVGLDDNQPLSLTGSQAALPIWTAFMKTVHGGRPNVSFEVPSGITVAEIDRDTGLLATPGCPRTIDESFLVGTEPVQFCPLHNWALASTQGLGPE